MPTQVTPTQVTPSPTWFTSLQQVDHKNKQLRIFDISFFKQCSDKRSTYHPCGKFEIAKFSELNDKTF